MFTEYQLMQHPCLVVLTARGTDRLLDEGGSQAWRLNPDNASRFAFCVCVQNRRNGHWGGADHEHHHAFMIGRISEVVASPERADRFLVKFSEYALIDRPNAWPGLRNPVRYGSLEEFGISSPDELQWIPMRDGPVVAPAAIHQDEEPEGFGPLTITEAKAGLALGLGVPETAIEISVRY